MQTRLAALLLISIGALISLSPITARAAAEIRSGPSEAEVAKRLADSPMTAENWPKWRPQLLAWVDLKSRATDPAFEAARQLMLREAPGGELGGRLADDAV